MLKRFRTGQSKAEQASNGATEEQLLAELDPSRLPRHVAIIMDGNGRWASRQGLPRAAGHRAGVAALKKTLEDCGKLGIGILTVYAFSTENWERPRDEVAFLMDLLDEVLRAEVDALHQNGVRLQVIGSRCGLPDSVVQAVEQATAMTAGNDRLVLNVALNYGGRSEIVAAAAELARDVAAGRLRAEEITAERFGSYLFTNGLPDPDLLIRTGGEYRVSNFLLWQLAYAEFWITPVYWPDFRRTHLLQALVDYQNRQRRFGRVP